MRKERVRLVIARHDFLRIYRMSPMENTLGDTMHIDSRVRCSDEEQVGVVRDGLSARKVHQHFIAWMSGFRLFDGQLGARRSAFELS